MRRPPISPLCSLARALSLFFWAPSAVLLLAELLHGCWNWWVPVFLFSRLCSLELPAALYSISCSLWNFPSNSQAANFHFQNRHFALAFPALFNTNTPNRLSGLPRPLCSVFCCSCAGSSLCWLGLSFYSTVCNVSDSHFFGRTGRCHRRICFQTWGRPAIENLAVIKFVF